jgi:hypothetical protein
VSPTQSRGISESSGRSETSSRARSRPRPAPTTRWSRARWGPRTPGRMPAWRPDRGRRQGGKRQYSDTREGKMTEIARESTVDFGRSRLVGLGSRLPLPAEPGADWTSCIAVRRFLWTRSHSCEVLQHTEASRQIPFDPPGKNIWGLGALGPAPSVSPDWPYSCPARARSAVSEVAAVRVLSFRRFELRCRFLRDRLTGSYLVHRKNCLSTVNAG